MHCSTFLTVFDRTWEEKREIEKTRERDEKPAKTKVPPSTRTHTYRLHVSGAEWRMELFAVKMFPNKWPYFCDFSPFASVLPHRLKGTGGRWIGMSGPPMKLSHRYIMKRWKREGYESDLVKSSRIGLRIDQFSQPGPATRYAYGYGCLLFSERKKASIFPLTTAHFPPFPQCPHRYVTIFHLPSFSFFSLHCTPVSPVQCKRS